MPNTSAPQETAAISFTEDHLTSLHKNVADNLQQAGIKTPLDGVASSAYVAVRPVHVPEENPKRMVDQTQINAESSVPGSFKSTPETALSPLKALSEHLDYADQIVTGRSHVLDEAERFTSFKKEKEGKRMEFANTPKSDSRGPVKKLVDWLHH